MEDWQRFLKERGASAVGFASLDDIDPAVRFDLPRAIAIAVALDRSIIAQIRTGPTHPYWEEYRRANTLLDEIARQAMERLKSLGHRARSYAATDQDIDWKTFATPLPHKTVVTRAGLGWIGRSALVVTRAFGAALRFTSVLTDAPLPVGSPQNTSLCGACTACVEACPAGAITGEAWALGTPRDSIYSAIACYRQCKIFCDAAKIDTVICGICIAACPWTIKYTKGEK